MSQDYKSLSVDVKRTLQGVRGIEEVHAQLTKQFQKEVHELERKYAAAYQLVYDRRKSILSGQTAATDQEVAAGEEKSRRLDPGYKPLSPVDLKEMLNASPIDGFWYRVIRAHHFVSQFIGASDEPALKQLTDVAVVYPERGEDNLPCFGVKFEFSPNSFFSNGELTAVFVYNNHTDFHSKFTKSHVLGDKIVAWKEGIDLIQQAKNEGEGSIFELFMPPALVQSPESKEAHRQHMRHDEEGEQEHLLEQFFGIGEALKETVVPRSVDYFTGDAVDVDDVEVDFGDDMAD